MQKKHNHTIIVYLFGFVRLHIARKWVCGTQKSGQRCSCRRCSSSKLTFYCCPYDSKWTEVINGEYMKPSDCSTSTVTRAFRLGCCIKIPFSVDTKILPNETIYILVLSSRSIKDATDMVWFDMKLSSYHKVHCH